ncbi:MAG: CHAD domain-containing protein, partial [Burkholderiales bacterium]|nr:CHAD domain-containing protein [Burkholderiales bacterium]
RPQREPPLAAAARAVLRPAWRRLLADAAGFAAAPVEQQHRTRKRLKRLRYTLEVLLPLLRRKPARALLARIGPALEALGELNDLQAAQAHWRQRAAQSPQAWFAVGWLAAQAEHAGDRAAAALKRLTAAPRPWRRKRGSGG